LFKVHVFLQAAVVQKFIFDAVEHLFYNHFAARVLIGNPCSYFRTLKFEDSGEDRNQASRSTSSPPKVPAGGRVKGIRSAWFPKKVT
jgi:hypothetical protein